MDPATPSATQEQQNPKNDAPASNEKQSPDLATLVEAQNRELQKAREELARVQSILILQPHLA